MGITSLTTDVTGQVGLVPRRVKMVTTDNLATITTANYLNQSTLEGRAVYATDVFDVIYSFNQSTNTGTYGEFLPTISSGIITLNENINEGNVTFPVVDGDFAVFDGTAGKIKDAGYLPSDATKTKVIMASAAVTANHIACFSDTSGTVNDDVATAINGGNIQAGVAGTAGSFISFPATAANGTLIVQALNAGADFDTTIRNAASVGQDQVITIPDSGAATANFLLDTGAANILAKQQFVGLSNVLTFGTGTWTVTRIAQGNYVSRHSVADETSIIAIDITPAIRVAASKGFRLDSFDVIYSIATDPLDAHTVVIDRIEYANNVAVSVNSIAVTGALATAAQANPYVTNVAVDTPAFDVTADSKYVIELTVNNSAASEYDYYGIMLRFSETIG